MRSSGTGYVGRDSWQEFKLIHGCFVLTDHDVDHSKMDAVHPALDRVLRHL
jgi:hypothetical protein